MLTQIFLGLRSGTSHDGSDAAVAEIGSSRERWHVRQRAVHTVPYPRSVHKRRLCPSQGAMVNAGAVAQVNVLLGQSGVRAAWQCGNGEDEFSPFQPAYLQGGEHGKTCGDYPR